MRRRSGARHAWVIVVACVLVSLAHGGCADPVVQYHRQFEYLLRVGSEALDEGRFDEAREHLLQASTLAPISAATDLEVIDALTRLTRACRELGELDDALVHANAASQILARHRLDHGGTSSGVYRVGAAYLLERGRLEVARGDFLAAEEALVEFLRVRGDGGDLRESSETQQLLGELKLALGLEQEARARFRASLDQARSMSKRDATILGLALLRVAESKLARDRVASAQTLALEARPESVDEPALRPGVALVRGRIDAAQGNPDRARVRLEDGLALLETDDPVSRKDVAAPARAIVLAASSHDPVQDADALVGLVLRALRSAETGSPLRGMQAGRRAVEAGRVAFDAGAWASGLQMMAAGRDAIGGAIGGRAHDALVAADFEIVTALEARNRLVRATRRCAWLVGVSDRLSPRARALHPKRLLVCGRVAVAGRDSTAARTAFGRALILSEEDSAAPILRVELLLRMAALAHGEGRDAEEQKLFARVLPFVLPGVYEDLEKLLVDAYGPYGRYQPSSAAARLGHAAARSHSYVVEAPQLQELAEKLGVGPMPASR